MTIQLRSALEEDEGRVLVHESGHALMAALQGILCHGIYSNKSNGQLCALADVPRDPADYNHKDYLFVAASSAAELILLGNQSDEGSQSDHKDFAGPGAPSLQEAIEEAQTILSSNKRKLKRLVSKLKAKLKVVDYDLDLLPETDMDGTDVKFAVLLLNQGRISPVRNVGELNQFT